MNLSNQTKKEIINKFQDLFILTDKKYLIMFPNGQYKTYNLHSKQSKAKPLTSKQIEGHLDGRYTLGVFAQNYLTKFICFDIDVREPLHAKWVTYSLIDVLISIGIPEKYIHISTSGNKGYHVDIYFSDTLSIEVIKEFYHLIIGKIDLSMIEGEIELRPTNQGLKLPLGINFKNGNKSNNKCWYVSYDGLQPIKSYKYILNIKKINPNIIKNIIEKETDMPIADIPINEELAGQIEESKDYIDTNYKPLKSYSAYENERLSIEHIKDIEERGLKQVGTRHNYLLALCRYYKHLGMEPEENINALSEWINKQDTNTYTTSLDDCYKEINVMVKHAYKNDIPFIADHKEIFITYLEMLDIIKAKSKNEKLLLYAIVIHSKRYANNKGVFFMTYNQMVAATGLSEKTTRNLINKLEKQDLIQIVERNRKIIGSNGLLVGKKPNKYKINFDSYNIGHDNKIIINNESTFNNVMLSFFDIKELQSILPRRQYEDIRSTSVNN